MKQTASFFSSALWRILIVALVILFVGVPLVLVLTSQFAYFLVRVEPQEVGVQFQGGQIKDIVGPGVYSDFGLYVELRKVSSQAIPFNVRDEEIITKDKQRIGLVVTGDALRPGIARKDVLLANWAQYSQLYLDDVVAQERVKSLAQQAMKVCVGERPFDDAIIGTARDELRNCIDDELSKLAEIYGLVIQNVVVPEVVLSPEVQAALDAIVQSRLETEKAAQDKLRAEAQAQAEQARQEGEIRVEQSRIQEETKQQTILAQLEQEKIRAQQAVIQAEKANELAKVEAERSIIEAQKSNDLFSAQQDLEINRALAVAAAEKAKADLAAQLALAELYANSPAYLQLQIAQANASALNATDKVIFTPEGTTPTIVLPGPGITPTVNTTPR
ncbi:MAG: SPFH domain-containing protein [Anaerolineales bacterium]|nr:SPFH domain-containing protein [Anaerolineales bacterium]